MRFWVPADDTDKHIQQPILRLIDWIGLGDSVKKLIRVASLIADPSQCNSNNRQIPNIRPNRSDFLTNDAI